MSELLAERDYWKNAALEARDIVEDLRVEVKQAEQRLAAAGNRLRALLEGLECQSIEVLMKEPPGTLREVGTQMARAAKLGSPLYLAALASQSEQSEKEMK
jgi:hypothetical protein